MRVLNTNDKAKKMVSKVYKVFGRPGDILDGDFFDYFDLRIGDFIKILDDKKISRVRMSDGATWVETLLFLWRRPEKILQQSCKEEDIIDLCEFLLKIKENEKYTFKSRF